MKKIKILIVFIVILLIYSLFIIFIFQSKDNDQKNNTNNTKTNNNSSSSGGLLVVNNGTFLEYKNDQFYEINKSVIEKQDKMKVYINNKYFGDYKLQYGSVWNLFDDKDEYISYNGSLIAFNEEFNIKVRDFTIRNINDKDKVFLINNYNVNTFDYLTYNQAIDIDLDNNGVMDEIICLSSMEDSENINNYYNIVVVRLNDNNFTLINEKGKEANAVYSLSGIINILDSPYDSIIVGKMEGIESPDPIEKNLVYSYKNDNYMID